MRLARKIIVTVSFLCLQLRLFSQGDEKETFTALTFVDSPLPSYPSSKLWYVFTKSGDSLFICPLNLSKQDTVKRRENKGYYFYDPLLSIGDSAVYRHKNLPLCFVHDKKRNQFVCLVNRNKLLNESAGLQAYKVYCLFKIAPVTPNHFPETEKWNAERMKRANQRRIRLLTD